MDSKLTNLNQNTNLQVMPSKKTEEEKVGKVIRCIINFIEDEPELIKY